MVFAVKKWTIFANLSTYYKHGKQSFLGLLFLLKKQCVMAVESIDFFIRKGYNVVEV